MMRLDRMFGRLFGQTLGHVFRHVSSHKFGPVLRHAHSRTRSVTYSSVVMWAWYLVYVLFEIGD